MSATASDATLKALHSVLAEQILDLLKNGVPVFDVSSEITFVVTGVSNGVDVALSVATGAFAAVTVTVIAADTTTSSASAT